MPYRCVNCGYLHQDDELPGLGIDKPDYWWTLPETEREQRAKLTADTCVIDNKHFFIRGVIEIPIQDTFEHFGIGVWVSQKRKNFVTYINHFDSGEIGPFFGRLSTNLDFYAESTLDLKTRVHFQEGGLRPQIKVEPGSHQLAIDQQKGITLNKAWEIVHFYSNPF